jgi:hypothetical protein
MSVYHSFHAVGEEVAALRRRRAVAEKNCEAKRDEAGELRRQAEAMAAAAAAAAQQRDEWNARIRQLDSAAAESISEGPPGAGTEAASTTSALGLPAELRRRQLRASIREAREEFRRSSLEFRRASGLARLRAAALGLDAGNLCALAYLSSRGAGGEGGEGGSNDGGNDGLAAALDTLAETLDERHRRDRVLDDDDLDADPTCWKRLDLQDEDVRKLWEAYTVSKDRCEAAERERDQADGILEEARRQAGVRRQRLEPLRSQLDRVSRENRQLRARIQGLRGPSSAGRRGPGDEEGASCGRPASWRAACDRPTCSFLVFLTRIVSFPCSSTQSPSCWPRGRRRRTSGLEPPWTLLLRLRPAAPPPWRRRRPRRI